MKVCFVDLSTYIQFLNHSFIQTLEKKMDKSSLIKGMYEIWVNTKDTKKIII